MTGSGDAGIGEPLLRPSGRRSRHPRPRDRAILFPGLFALTLYSLVAAVPPCIRGRATADQVGRVRVPQRAGAHRHRLLDRRDPALNGFIGGIAFLAFPLVDRDRGPAVPPLRPGRRGEKGARLHGPRVVRHARRTGARGRARRPGSGQGSSFLTMVAAVIVAVDVPAGPRTSFARFAEPPGVREARDAVRGADRVLRTRGRRLRDEDVLSADGADARRRDRRRTARVWLSVGSELRRPPLGRNGAAAAGPRCPRPPARSRDRARHAVEVRAGELLGALSVACRPTTR